MFIISSRFKLHCPTTAVCFYFNLRKITVVKIPYIPSLQPCWRVPLVMDNMCFDPRLGQEKMWLIWHVLGELWAASSIPGSFTSICTCPSSYSELPCVVSRESKERTGRCKELTLYCSLLLVHYLHGQLWKKDILLTDQSSQDKAAIQTLEPYWFSPSPACKGRVHFLCPGCWNQKEH